MIASATSTTSEFKYNDPYRFALHQCIFAFLGLIIMLILSKIDYKIFYKYSNLLLLISFILLILVLIPGVGIVRNGSRSWFGIGSFGIQPSELMKLTLIIFVSKYISNHENKMDELKNYGLPIIMVIILSFLLILLEPDFGSGMILVASVFLLLFTSKMKLSFFYKIGFLGIIGVILLVIIAPYRLKRITSFINPWTDPLGSGFQSIMSMYAIGPGGLFGKGLGNSIQKKFYLPEPGTDFIFAIIAEELGFISVLIITISYILLFIIVIKSSLETKDVFGKYLSFGLAIELLIQTLINIMVVVGLIPITGVTLPFISYGGSSLLISMSAVGIILSIIKSN